MRNASTVWVENQCSIKTKLEPGLRWLRPPTGGQTRQGSAVAGAAWAQMITNPERELLGAGVAVSVCGVAESAIWRPLQFGRLVEKFGEISTLGLHHGTQAVFILRVNLLLRGAPRYPNITYHLS